MAKNKKAVRLYKQLHPIFAFTIISLVVAIFLTVLFLQGKQYSNINLQPYKALSIPTDTPILNKPQLVPTVTPPSINISSWRTFTNWADGISVKLPPQFFPQWPGRMPTPLQLNPDGTVQWSYEDFYTRDLTPTNNYRFSVRINKPGHVNFNNSCTTDEECFNLLYNFYKSLPNTKIYLLHAKILNKDIKGLAIAYKDGTQGTVPSDKGIITDMYFEFTYKGKAYELSIDTIGSYAELFMKQPYIDMIASSISFSQ